MDRWPVRILTTNIWMGGIVVQHSPASSSTDEVPIMFTLIIALVHFVPYVFCQREVISFMVVSCIVAIQLPMRERVWESNPPSRRKPRKT